MQQAIAAKADGILLYGISCNQVAQPVANAVRAHIQVLSTATCSAASGAGSLQFDPGYQSTPAIWGLVGQVAAWKTIQATGGKANVLFYDVLGDEDTADELVGFQSVMKQCSACHVTLVSVSLAQLTPALSATVQSNLLANPEANAIMVSFASVYDIGLGAGLARVNRKIFVMSGQQSTSFYTSIHTTEGSNVTLACVTGTSPGQSSWAAIDQLNRQFNGSPAVAEGGYLAVTDATQNLPPSGQAFEGAGERSFFSSRFPYMAQYEKVWNAS